MTPPGRDVDALSTLRATFPTTMKAMIQELVAKADLSEAQATKVAEVVRDFLASRVPEGLRGPLEAALTGERVDDAVDLARGLLGSLLK